MHTPLGIVFDLDGTLLDTRLDITSSCNYALQAHGFSPVAVEQVVRFVGDGSRLLISRVMTLPEHDPQVDQVLATFLEHYAAHPMEQTQWLPCATRALENLWEMPLAICTNKPRAVTERVLAALQAEERFSAVIALEDAPKPKPAPDPLIRISEILGCETDELVMIGDGPQDILAGKAVDARTIAVATGYTHASILQSLRPDMLLENLCNVPEVIKRWRQATAPARRSGPPRIS